jgi:Uma2 family endonuclease
MKGKGSAMKPPTMIRTGPITYDDFCAMVGDGQKADLIDGVIYMASPDNTDANELFVWLVSVMSLFARRCKLGKVYGSRVACRLDEKNGPEPDIVFVATKNLVRVKRGGIEGTPDLAVEIVSPDSVERDYYKKRLQYERFGVPEYWIVDEMDEAVLLLRLDSKGKYREVKSRKGILHSQVLTGFWLDPRWLWQRPFADEADTVQRIMA